MSEHDHTSHDHDHDNCCSVEQESSENWFSKNFEYVAILSSLVLLLTGILLDFILKEKIPNNLRLCFYLIAYIPVAWPVWKNAFRALSKGDFFNEFMLMGIATLGAFLIGEYPEGVTVMLFYAIGELFQSAAVRKAKSSIKALLDQRPDQVIVLEGNNSLHKKAETVAIGEIIQLRPGDKLSLDGELLSEKASFNTSALTGESMPDTKHKGEPVLAGMINMTQVCEIKVTHAYSDSKLSRILTLVQEASGKKAATELFIRKFARIYTPIVFFLALGIIVFPFFLLNDYVFRDWLYRSLIFLVVSCPCALVISIPLGYFGGIGAGSRNGILFKGATFLDLMASVKTVVLDKTGTLTKGIFKVQEITIAEGFDQQEVLTLVALMESKSSHPIAKAITEFTETIPKNKTILTMEEIAGHGLKGLLDGKEILVGNTRLLDNYSVPYPVEIQNIPLSVVLISIDRKFAGYLTIADELKESSALTVETLQGLGIETIMLSGDKNSVVKYIAGKLKIKQFHGELLPEDKLNKVQEIRQTKTPMAFAGDGINDAPALALADIGIAMGGLGSEATIETADIVIQNDNPSKIIAAIQIGKMTRKIVWQNISLAIGIKALVLLLGASGVATMWEAIFADVGVALLAILNAMRIQRMKF
jgi:Zn2+/Cd2+-exporting ATPase